MTAHVYVVIASEAYEYSNAFVAFTNKESADAFANKCKSHESARPRAPDDAMEDSPEGNALYAKWVKVFKRWERQHPAKENICSYYDVQELELRP